MNFPDVVYRYPARFIVLDGFRTAYVDVNAEAGAPVLFLHDAGADLDEFAYAYELLSTERRVLGVDLIGFGKSDKPRIEDTVVECTRLVGLFLDALEIDRVSVVGHGLGASVAARFAAENPDRLDRLVLAAPIGTQETTEGERATTLDFFSYERLVQMKREERRAWYEAMVAGWNSTLEAHLQLRDALSQSVHYRLWAHAVEDSVASALRHPIAEVGDRIEAPTLVVWGKDDPIAPFASAGAVRDAILGARLAPIEGCGHLMTMERSAAFVDLIAHFLSSGHARATVTEARGALDLEPWPGLSPEIGRLARALFEQRDVLVKMTAGIPLDDVAWQPVPNANSIGALLLHLGATTVWYLYEMLRGEPVPVDLCVRYRLDPDDPDAPLSAPRKSAGRLIAEVELAHMRLLEWLKTRGDADLNHTFTARDGELSATLRWILWHLAEDTLHHRGQIAYIKRLLAERAR